MSATTAAIAAAARVSARIGASLAGRRCNLWLRPPSSLRGGQAAAPSLSPEQEITIMTTQPDPTTPEGAAYWRGRYDAVRAVERTGPLAIRLLREDALGDIDDAYAVDW